MKPLSKYATPISDAAFATKYNYYEGHVPLNTCRELEKKLAMARWELETLIEECLIMERDHESAKPRWFEVIEAPSAKAITRALETLNLTAPK